MALSNLQLSLVVAGGLVLAIVVAHGAWSSRRNTPKQADPSDAPGNAGGAGMAHISESGELIEPRMDSGFAGTPFPVPVIARAPALDALIDVIAPMTLDAPLSGDAILAAMPATRRVGSKTFLAEGLSVADGQWEMPRAGQRYGAVQVGVQLANRLGALKDIEYSEFVVKSQAFADAINAAIEFPEMRHEILRAKELDAFASAHDAQLGFTLRARHAAWSPGFIAQHAAKLGFVAGVMPGRMVLPAPLAASSAPAGTVAAPILTLEFDTQAALADDPNQSAIRELALGLDVPQVSRAEQPFVQMRAVAQALAQEMDGVVTDDNGQPLPAEAMDAIGAELETLYDTLDARELSAGSPLARRLFS